MADEQFPAAATALEEYQSIEEQMASPEVVSNPDKLRKLGRRHAELGAIVGAYKAWLQVKDDLAAAQEMAGEDADFAEEAKRLEDELPGVEEKLRTALIPRDPDDARDTIMEIKAGTGGEEAALFAGDLLRMYTRYAEKRGWSVNVQSENTTELGGVWDLERFDAICDWADERGLPVFLDGARLGSALTSPAAGGLTLEHIAARCGAFYIGGTKNGLLMGEAMVISHPRLREAFPYLQKERGGLLAKGRLLGVQFEAAFEAPADGGEAPYWRLARGANECALRLRAGLAELGFKPYGDSASNQQFFVVTPAQRDAFEAIPIFLLLFLKLDH